MKGNAYNTNLASEFHVLSLLYRRGMDANLTLGNKKAVDIVVVRAAGDTATIDVKAVVGKVDWLVGNVPTTPRPNHFVALVAYDGKFQDLTALPRVWILPHKEFLEFVKAVKPPSTMRYISRKDIPKFDYRRDAWDLMSGDAAC